MAPRVVLSSSSTITAFLVICDFYQKTADGPPKPYLSLKLDSQKIDDLPLPRPVVEIFVHSPRVDAVHLRGGKVARGGLRWSDRKEDFRTEILGLMKLVFSVMSMQCSRRCGPISIRRQRTARRNLIYRLNSTVKRLTTCRCRGPSWKYSSIRRGSTPFICAAARLLAAAFAGPIARKIFVPKFSG